MTNLPPQPNQTVLHRHPRMKELMDDVFQSDTYREELEQSKDRQQAMGAALLDLMELESYENNELSPDGYIYNLAHKAPAGLRAQQEMRTMRGNLNSREEKARFGELKDQVIELNHALRDVIMTNPNISFGELEFITIGSYKNAESRKLENQEERELREATYAILNGMRHEVAVEDMIGMIDDFTCDSNVTVEEEKQGIDMFISYKNNEYAVDIKASRAGEKRAESNRHHRNDTNHIALWSGLSKEDFRGSAFRLHPNKVRAKSKQLRSTLLSKINY